MASSALDRALSVAERASRLAVWLGGAMLIFAAFMTTLDVILRKLFSWSFGGADEISGYLFAIATAFAFAFATLQRAHVRIDALYMHLPRPVQIVLDIVGFLLLGGFLGTMTWRALLVWWESYQSDSVSITPLVTPLDVPQGFWVAGLLFFMVVFTLMALRVAVAVGRGEWLRISELIGARTLDEEIAEEREHAEAELAREHARARREEAG